MTYILFIADFDSDDSDVRYFQTTEELCEHFGDDNLVAELLREGVFKGEYWDYHLVIVKEIL